jgi:hypothetical protein
LLVGDIVKKVYLYITTIFLLIVFGGCSKVYQVKPEKGYMVLNEDFPICSSQREVKPVKYVHAETDSIFYSFCEGQGRYGYVYDGIEVQNDNGIAQFTHKIYSKETLTENHLKKVDDIFVAEKKNKYVDSFYLLDLNQFPNVAILYNPISVFGNYHYALDAEVRIYLNTNKKGEVINRWLDDQSTYMPQKLTYIIKEKNCTDQKLLSQLDHFIADSNNLILNPVLDCYWNRIKKEFQKHKNNLAVLEKLHKKHPKFSHGTAIYIEALITDNQLEKAKELIQKEIQNSEFKNISADILIQAVIRGINSSPKDRFEEKIALLDSLEMYVDSDEYKESVAEKTVMFIRYGYVQKAHKYLKKHIEEIDSNPHLKLRIDKYWNKEQLLKKLLKLAENTSFSYQNKIAVLQVIKSNFQDAYFQDNLKNIDQQIQKYTYAIIKDDPEKLQAYLKEHPYDTKAKAYLAKIANTSYEEVMKQKDQENILFSLKKLLQTYPNLKINNYTSSNGYDKRAYDILKKVFASNDIDTIEKVIQHLNNTYWTKFPGTFSELSSFGGMFGMPSGRSVKIDYIISNLSLAIESNASKETISYLLDRFGFAVNFKSPYKNQMATSGRTVLGAKYYWFVENPINTAIKYNRYDLLPVLTNPTYFKNLYNYPAGYRYLDKDGIIIDTMLTLKDRKSVKILEKELGVSVEKIFQNILDNIYSSWSGPRANIRYAKKFKPFVSKESFQKLLEIEQLYNEYEAEQERLSREKRNSPCYKKYQKCLKYCNLKTDKNGSLFSSSDKSRCISSCYMGKSYCEKGDYEEAKDWTCNGICEGIDKYNGTLFRASSFSKCKDNCKADY